MLIIRRSKSDHDSAGREVAVPCGTDPITCPVRTVRAWVAALADRGITDGPLFRRIDRHGRLGVAAHGAGDVDGRMTGQGIALAIRRAALRAGLLHRERFTGHSLRRGLATASYPAGAYPLLIARHGGWADGSPVLLGCVEEIERWHANPLARVGL